MKRLTDEQIQEYLNGDLSSAEKALVESVLQKSPAERERFNHYKSLAKALAEEPEFELSPNFAHNVVVGMKEDGAEKVLFKFSQIILWLVGIATAIAVTVHFTNFTPLINEFKELRDEGSSAFSAFNALLQSVFGGIDINIALIGMVVIVLGAIFLIDRAISRVRSDTASLLC